MRLIEREIPVTHCKNWFTINQLCARMALISEAHFKPQTVWKIHESCFCWMSFLKCSFCSSWITRNFWMFSCLGSNASMCKWWRRPVYCQVDGGRWSVVDNGQWSAADDCLHWSDVDGGHLSTLMMLIDQHWWWSLISSWRWFILIGSSWWSMISIDDAHRSALMMVIDQRLMMVYIDQQLMVVIDQHWWRSLISSWWWFILISSWWFTLISIDDGH